MSSTPPQFALKAFACPHCGAYAHMNWRNTIFSQGAGRTPFVAATCHHCHGHSLWLKPNESGDQTDVPMIYPDTRTAPLPHEDMPQVVRDDYLEAREIAQKSPRSAAALLRLALQKLLRELQLPGKNINDDIARLVSQGLPPDVQKALDVVRVVGNNAVHPGELSNDVPQVAQNLFELVNFIVEDRISRPKKLSALYTSLPPSALDAIDRRDKNGA